MAVIGNLSNAFGGAGSTVNIAAGTTVVASGGVQLVLPSANFVNNGLYLDTTSAGSFTISNLLNFSGTGTTNFYVVNVNTGSTVTCGDSVNIYSTLNMTSGTLAAGGKLTLMSTASGTARIPTIAGGNITGNVNCQKYIAVPGTDTNRRAYRFWAHPFSSSIPLSQIEKDIDITGSGGSINGFTTSTTNNPSCEWYNPVTGNSTLTADPGWTWFTSTNGIGANAFKPKEGINLFIRGKKGEGISVCSSCYTPSPVTITMTGPVNQGTIIDTMAVGIHSDYNQLGNPYPSPVNIGAIINTAKTASNVKGVSFFVWNPYMATAGAFEAKAINATPYYLEAYCSFQVRAFAGGKTLTFSESNKSATSTEQLLRGEDNYVSLFIYDANYNIWDKYYLSFNSEATNAVDDDYDAVKPVNPDLNFYSLSSDNEKLTVDARPYKEGQIIPLGITTDYKQQFVIKVENLPTSASQQLYLHDKYLRQYVALQQGTEYRFNITDDAASQGNSRFELGVGNIPNEALAQNDELKLSLIPNPAKDEVTCNYQSATAQNTSIRITDVSGASVMTKELGISQNGNTKLTLGNLPPGVYMVELVSGDKKATQRLVKE